MATDKMFEQDDDKGQQRKIVLPAASPDTSGHDGMSATVNPATTLSATVILFILAAIALLVFTRFEASQSLVYYYDEKEDFSQVLPQSMTDKIVEATTTLTSNADPAKYLQPLYKQLIQKPGDDTIHYYLGVCYFQMDDATNAIRHFRNVLRQPQSKWQQKAQFRLGLALLKAKQPTEAKPLFEKIVRQPHHPYREKAANILKEKELF